MMKSGAVATWLLPAVVLLLFVAASPTGNGAAAPAPKLRLQSLDTRMDTADVDTVCCKLSSRVWWSGAHQCKTVHGSATSEASCTERQAEHDAGQRVCCHKDSNMWWSTYDKCGTVGGRATSSATCGADWNNHAPAGGVK
jgi:hypothetical protein